MPPSELSRVFISYARKDGATLAQRLQTDLKEQGFDAWLDTQRIAGGATWTTDIEHALDDAEFVLALMTSGSYVSEICRAEQLRALRKDKCVIPLKAQTSADVPLYLEARNYRDFTAESRYAQAFTELLADLQARNGIALRAEFRETSYVTVPPLPVNFVARPEALAALRNALIADDGGRHIALTALQGMGGIGKTVLAQALCHDEVVQQAFPDGIVWITIGKESAFDALTRMREVGKALGDDLSRYENELAAKNQYRSTIRKKAALIVVDDVWRSSDLEPLRAEDSPRSRLLFTTRDASIAAAMGAREHIADLLTEEQSREVLARWSRTGISNLPSIAAQLIHECGRLPLALSMVGAMLRGKPATYWNAVLDHLRNADLDTIKAQFPDYPYTDVLRAMQVSVDSLDPTSRDRYVALAVLLEEMAAAPPVQQCLWGVGENQAAETAEQFVNLSLAQRDQREGSIRLHDVQLDYVRAQYKDKPALELIRGAVRLSSNVIARSPEQFVSQMVARLLPYQDTPAIAEFGKRTAEGAPAMWFRALQPALHPPGTALIRTLEGHAAQVECVAISRDGRIVVSSDEDGLVKSWDVESGSELHSFHGHSESVEAVAMSADGRIAVSASDDTSVRVWDVASGRELHTLAGHSEFVRGVAVSDDGHIALSGSVDDTLKVWDVENARELRTVPKHKEAVYAVALTGDGRTALSTLRGETLKLWDVESGRELRALAGKYRSVEAVALSGDGHLAVAACRGKKDHYELKIWDAATGRELRDIPTATEGHSGVVWKLALSANGKFVAAPIGTAVQVWNLDTGLEVATLRGHSDSVESVALTEDGSIAVSASADQTLKVWDVKNGRSFPTLQSHSASITGVAVSDDGRTAVSGSDDGTLKVHELDSGREIRTINCRCDDIHGVALSGDGRIAAVSTRESGEEDSHLQVWVLDSGEELCWVQSNFVNSFGVSLSKDGNTVCAAAGQILRLWQLPSGHELHSLNAHSASVTGVALSADGRFALSASFDHTMKLWVVKSGRRLRTMKGPKRVTGAALSGDGRRAISICDDNTMMVWDAQSGTRLRTITGHLDEILDVALTNDGHRAVSASADHTLKLWDAETGAALAAFTCDGSVASCVFVNQDTILAGDAGGHLHLLRLEEPKPKK